MTAWRFLVLYFSARCIRLPPPLAVNIKSLYWGMSFGSPNLRSTHRSKVAPPPFVPPLLERREPATEWLQRKHDQQPNGVYPRDGQSEPGRLLPLGRAEQPAGIAERWPR